MSRRKIKKRVILPDPRFCSVEIAKFINKVMQCGKKSIAEHIVYEALNAVSVKVNVAHVDVMEKIMANVKPLVEVRSKRVGGATYQVPVEVVPERGASLAMCWIINAARAKHGKSMVDGLTAEFLDAYNTKGTAVKKREDTHRMAESNRAFAHLRW